MRRHLVTSLLLAAGSGLLVAAFLLAGLGAGCASSGVVMCHVGADCASGVCGPDGRCVLAADGGGDAAAPAPDGAPAADAGSEAATPPGDGPAVDATPIVCTPNHDGVITRDEVPLAAGLHATYRVATNATVATAGTTVGGVLTWDLSGALTGDHALLLETRPMTGLWFASSFPDATYAARLSDGNTLLGVFQITNDALLMLGVASEASGALTQTLLTYDPPVTVLAFPLQVGSTWTTTSTVTGQASGVYSMYTEKYESQVDVRGSMITPFSTFDVLRVGTKLTRTLGVVVTTSRTYAFATECFNTVATIRSQDNETATEFTSAAEVWRLAP